MSTTTRIDLPSPSTQRSARNDPDMRDGDSGHGNPYEPAADEVALDSDADLEDETESEEVVDELSVREPTAVGVVGLPSAPDLPIADYADLTIPEVMERAGGLSVDELDRLIAFERSHRNRKTLLAKLRRLVDHS
jgi:hypothetical protein